MQEDARSTLLRDVGGRNSIEEIDRATKLTRKIGLGVMGWHDALMQLGVPYDSEEALTLLSRLPETAETRRVAAAARLGAEPSADGDVEGRLDGLLERVKEDQAARQEFVDLLEVLGPDDPRTPRYRKALATKIY